MQELSTGPLLGNCLCTSWQIDGISARQAQRAQCALQHTRVLIKSRRQAYACGSMQRSMLPRRYQRSTKTCQAHQVAARKVK